LDLKNSFCLKNACYPKSQSNLHFFNIYSKTNSTKVIQEIQQNFKGHFHILCTSAGSFLWDIIFSGILCTFAGCYENIISHKRKSGKCTGSVIQPKIEGDLENSREFIRCSM
jgi:hypothetical protein